MSYTEEFNPYTYRNFYNGGGVALGDINNDGLIDIFLSGNIVDNKLYLNKGDFTFEDITNISGVACKNVWSTGATFVDINNDGYLDLYVCKSGKPGGERRYNELFINNKDLTFTEKSKEYGLDITGLSVHSAFFDADKDGDLDIYLLNNSIRSVGGYDLIKDQREISDPNNNGNKYLENIAGKYVDKSKEAGIYNSAIGFGLGITLSDFNNDNWPDLFISNDFFERDYYYLNNQKGGFVEAGDTSFSSLSMGSMGADAADLDNDLKPDLVVTEMLPQSLKRRKTKATYQSWDKYQLAVSKGYSHQFPRNAIQRNTENGFFEIGRISNLSGTEWSWASLLFDMDNDGYKDIFISNGIYKDLLDRDYLAFMANETKIKSMIQEGNNVITQLIDAMPSSAVPNQSFKNLGAFEFAQYNTNWGFTQPTFSNGSAYGDLDNDGDLDLVINNVNMPALVYRNNSDTLVNRSLQIKLVSNNINTSEIGTKAIAYPKGMDPIVSELYPSKGFQSSVPHRLHFGVGPLKTVDSLHVIWPDGTEEKFFNLKTNKLVTLSKTDNKKVASPQYVEDTSSFYEIENVLHRENKFIDFNRDRLVPIMCSNLGPGVAITDIDGDGSEEVFFGGAKNQASILFDFKDVLDANISDTFEKQRKSESTKAVFFDADLDGDQDLWVANGGRSYTPFDTALDDHYYENQNGTLVYRPNHLPFPRKVSSGALAVGDFNKDGYEDVFVGEYLKNLEFGLPGDGFLFTGTSEGFQFNPTAGFENLGMITAAQFADINNDGWLDLVIVGDWMRITTFINYEGVLKKEVVTGLEKTRGNWNCLSVVDLNGDGFKDIIAGNMGRNNFFEKEMRLYVSDFDKNGWLDQIMTFKRGDQYYPILDKDELISQIPSLKKKIVYYSDYAEKSMRELFVPNMLETALKYDLDLLETSVFTNTNGTFEPIDLPIEIQYSSVYSLLETDIDKDGVLDIVFGGNQYNIKPQFGRQDASKGGVLFGELKSEMYGVREFQSLSIDGQIREIKQIKLKDKKGIIFARNNDKPVFWEYE
ncbi:MAG: VCBS repeat-containing protein [Flavobacteriaceae bacterium]